MNVFELFAKISLDTSDYDNSLDEASGKLKKTGESLTKTGEDLTKKVSLPIAGLGAAIIKTGADYESGMSKVQAISGATGDEVKMLGDKAMEMAAQTKFSTAESAEAYQYMAMAGWDAQQMVDGLSGIMLLASASGEDLASTSDIVTDALTAFGLKASDSGRFADVLAAASNSANTNVSMLGESFKYVAPVAGAMGYSVEDVSVALGLMANSGIKASQAGTTLRSAITNMASPTSNMAKVMDEYGISLTDADGNMLSLAEVMEQLREKMGGLDEATQASAASTLFGKEAMSGMLAIINASDEDFNKLTESINNSSGTTQEMADVMNDNAAGAMAMLSSAINVLFTNLSEFLIPAFTEIVRKVTDAVNWFNGLSEGAQKAVLALGGVAAAVGPVLIVIGKIATGIGALGSVGAKLITGIGKIVSSAGGLVKVGGSLFSIIGKVANAAKALFLILAANPIGLVVTAIAALVAAFVYLWNTSEEFREFWIGLWEKLKEIVSNAVEGIKEFFGNLWSNIKETFGNVREFFSEKFTQAKEAVQEAWAGVKEFFGDIWENIKTRASEAWENVKSKAASTWDAVKTKWGETKEFFAGVWENVKTTAASAWEAVKTKGAEAWSGVKETWSAGKEFLANLWDSTKEKAASAWEAVKEKGTSAWENVKNAWGSSKEFFGGVWENISSKFSEAPAFFKDKFSSAWENTKSAFGNVKGFFEGKWSDIKGAFSGALAHFKGIGRDMLTGLWNGIADKVEWLKGKVRGVVDKIKGWFTGKDGFDEHSPSKWAKQVFQYVMEGGGQGLDAGSAALFRNVDSIVNRMKDSIDVSPVNLGISASGQAVGTGRNNASASGNTYVTINSPVAVDAIQAAREWKKTTQRMALGYV